MVVHMSTAVVMLSEDLADVIQSFAPFSSLPIFSFTGVTSSGVGTRINISYLFKGVLKSIDG